MAEWSIAVVLKTTGGASPPGVRIPLAPLVKAMPTRKIRDIDPRDKRFNPCRDPEHNLPGMRVFEPGDYEHECPSCGRVIRFSVYPHFTWSAKLEPIKTVMSVGRDHKRVTAPSEPWKVQDDDPRLSPHWMG